MCVYMYVVCVCGVCMYVCMEKRTSTEVVADCEEETHHEEVIKRTKAEYEEFNRLFASSGLCACVSCMYLCLPTWIEVAPEEKIDQERVIKCTQYEYEEFNRLFASSGMCACVNICT